MSTALVSPVAAPRTPFLQLNLRILFRETRSEFLRLSRTRSFALSVIGFPIIFYLFFGLIMNHGEHIGGLSVAKYELAGYAVFGMVGAALFGVGLGLSSELAAGWLELKRASPMPPTAYLLAKCFSAMAFGVVIVSLLVLMGITIGHLSLSPSEYARILGLTLVGVVPFACMGLALALLVPFNAAPGIANMIYLPMSFCGGLWVPIMLLPHVLQRFALVLPTYHLAQLMLRILGYPSAGSLTSHWFGLLGFTLLMLGMAVLAFRRREENS
jgi:ABC-2 type transport system permease protein